MINEKRKKKLRGLVVFVINEKKKRKKTQRPVVFVNNEKKKKKKKKLRGPVVFVIY